MKISLLTVVIALAYRAFGTNDWTKACLGGSCSFDIEASPASMSGTIQISGSSSSISDITPAAGWQILDCSGSTNNQTVRLVCTDESLGCGHIFQNGAQDTIVRLPQGCGVGPFVRVANHSISDDQSIPTKVTSRVMKRDGTTPQVHALQIDDDFSQASGQHGNVSFEVHAQGDFRVANGPKQSKRQNGSGSTFEVVFIQPESVTPFDLNLTCPAADGTTQTQFMFGSVSLDRAQFNTTIDITSTGTMSPPNIETLSFSAPSDALIILQSNFEAGLQGSTDIGFDLGSETFPSFSIAGVLEISPVFSVSGSASVNAQLLTNFIPETAFDISITDLQFTYPSNEPPASVNIPAPGLSFDVLALPTAGSFAEFNIGALFEFVVGVSAFSQSVGLEFSYSFSSNMILDSTPTSEDDEQVCIEINDVSQLNLGNSNAFFDAFSSGNTETIFSGAGSLFSNCTTLALGPAPDVTHATRSTLQSRDGVSCPPVAALPETSISITS
ncbi:hypothetical protein SCHPADRAFT_886884 [Schizopora paradoxa]|uniref:Uncharacterized protein n=1 Tax=Schizopora paradoxa TaxID=27342 RepID=A0A0H2SKG0_9AGAM|nr:hypothetical protein SCHPADRAFT_886884 [Schizopora paradoxa]